MMIWMIFMIVDFGAMIAKMIFSAAATLKILLIILIRIDLVSRCKVCNWMILVGLILMILMIYLL